MQARKSRTRRDQQKALTGDGDFSSLSANRSMDVVENYKLCMNAHLTTFKWKQLFQQVRAKEAFRLENMHWKRPARWLCTQFQKELGWIWGHTGSARQHVKPLNFR